MDDQDVYYDLICAVREGRLEIAKELVNSFGLSYSKGWSEGYYVLLCDAVRNNHSAVAKLLLSTGFRVNSKASILKPSNTPLHFAVKNGDIEIVRMILDKGANIDAKNHDGLTPLHNAIINKKMEVTELLLKHGADVNARDNDGTTPLHDAAEIGCLQIIEQLLKYGAYVNCMCTSTWRKVYAPLHFAVEKGNKEVVTLLLSSGANVDVKGEDNITPLHIAAKKGYTCIAEDLLNHGACIHSLTLKEGYTPLHFASELRNEEAVKLLLTRGADINTITKSNLSPLHIVTKAGHETVLKLLLQHGAKVDNRDKDNESILYLAVEKGHLTIVKEVLKYCPDINDQSNRSSLKIAVQGYRESYEKIVEALLEYGLRVNPEDKNNSELLHAAVEKGYLKIIEDLLKYGADVNMLYNSKYSKEGFTPLHSAAKKKQEEVAKLLISHEADINAQDKTGKTPIFYAIENADLNITKLLLTNGANIKDSPELLNIAVNKGLIEIVEALLQRDADVNASDKYGPLHIATKNKQEEVAKLLISHEADINAQDKTGKTPIFYAIENADLNITKLLLTNGANIKDSPELLNIAVNKGLIEIVEALLQHDADVNASDKYGPLHIATKNKQEEVAKLLISHEADINAQDKTGKTPIFYAIKNADLNITKLLLTNGANIKDSPELLNIAVNKGLIEIVEALLQHDADVNASDKYGRTALHYTVLNIKSDYMNDFFESLCSVVPVKLVDKKGEIAKLLLSKGANVDAQTKDGVTTLHAAIQKGYAKVVEALLEYNANVNFRLKSGITPLHLSGKRGRKEISIMLLNKGANVNAKQKNGTTELHIAAQNGHEKVVKVLLECGADINSRDRYGKTALHIASERGHDEAVVTLLEYGADINITSRINRTALDYAMIAIRAFDRQLSRDSDDDYYVLSCEETTEILKRHIVKMKTANLYVSKKNLLSVSSSYDVTYFQDECEKEIASMKSEKISNLNTTFYDIFAKGTSSLAIYMRNENIVQVLKSDNYRTKFPIYAGMLKSNFRKGMERKELLEQGNKIFHLVFNNLPELPYDCTEKIFSYLSDADLRILMARKPLGI